MFEKPSRYKKQLLTLLSDSVLILVWLGVGFEKLRKTLWKLEQLDLA